MAERNYFIGSVGQPGEGYDNENLERCIKFKAHIMHKGTRQKGVFSEVIPNSIFLLKYKDNLIAYGEVTSKSTEKNDELGDWNYVVNVNEWIFKNNNNPKEGVSNYGVSWETIPGSGQMSTIKKINRDFALQKMKEIDINSSLYRKIVNEKNMTELQNLLQSNQNLILTGAPGVGKTYKTAEIAVAFCDKTFTDFADRSKVMNKYKDLVASGQIAFTTFHQSLDYEEFVEGLKPEVTDDGQVIYEVKAGIFKTICENAKCGVQAMADFNIAYKSLLDRISREETLTLKTPKGKDFKVSINSKNNLNLLTGTDFKQNGSLTKEGIKEEFIDISDNSYIWKGYYQGVVNELKQNHKLKPKEQTQENQNFILIIDEINRGNISKIFGELITLLEKDKRIGEENEITVTLPYSQEKFGVPSNLYIIGTMNTADRSIGQIDYALRRRFAFYPLRADENLITDQTAKDTFGKIKQLIEKHINPDLDTDDIMIGHSYFMKDFENNLKYQITPLLLEYNNDGLITLEEDERKTLKEGNIPEIK